MDREEWLQERRRGLAVVILPPYSDFQEYKTPYAVWEEKSWGYSARK